MKDKIKKIREEIMGNFKCIQNDCDNNGSITVMCGDGDLEQMQCQFCDQVRFPLKEKIVEILEREFVVDNK